MRAAAAFVLLLGCTTRSGEADDVCAVEFQQDAIDAGVRTVGVQIPLEGGGSVHAEARWPAQGAGPWPVAVLIHGAWDPAGTPLDAGSIRADVSAGVVDIHLDLPGNGRTTGENDHRGAASRAAVAGVLAWAGGDRLDLGGCTLPERVPDADATRVYVIGTSNGGNLAAATLADTSLALPPIAGLVTWETPAGPQFANVELGADPTVYTPGTCTLTDEDGVVCDFPAESLVRDDTGGDPRLCFDRDGDAACGTADVRLVGVTDGGTTYLSPALARAAADAGILPGGYADAGEADAWWAERDAARLADALITARPDLPVMILASEVDHVQTLADHPHVFGFGEALQRAGAAWTRLNPGRDWLPGETEDNAPNLPLTLATPTAHLLPEAEENPVPALLSAAVLELDAEPE